MKTGTKSLLFGVHQFLWHPFTVWLAWIKLYHEFPNWRECFCIFIHDWGYWGCSYMDKNGGERHPERGARLALRLLGTKYYYLILLHSRRYAEGKNNKPSKLCWADKYSLIFEPWWLYLPRAIASGEIIDYITEDKRINFIIPDTNRREWFKAIKNRLLSQAIASEGQIER